MNALFGDVYKFRININGTDYTREGTKEYIKDTSGATDKDSYGNDRFIMKNRLEFRKTGAGLEFEFGDANLKDEGNVLYIANDVTGRESNRVFFYKKNSKAANYDYLTGSTLDESKKKELLAFEIGKDFEKKANPTSMVETDKNISLGKLNLTNLKSNEYYSLDFTIETNLATNPFSSVALNSINLEAVKNGGNTISYIYKKQ